MARRGSVETHEKRKEIERDVATGLSYRQIASQYGMSEAAVRRFVNGVGQKAIAKQFDKQLDTTADIIMRELWRDREILTNLREALVEWLTVDGKLNMNPRLDEISVVVDEITEEATPRRSEISGNALTKMIIEGTPYKPVEIRSRAGDNRALLLKALDGSLKHMDILLKGKELSMNNPDITRHPEYQKLEQELVEVLREYPEAMEAVKRLFEGSQ